VRCGEKEQELEGERRGRQEDRERAAAAERKVFFLKYVAVKFAISFKLKIFKNLSFFIQG
jgi:hypothetical protein